jgi:hypothetical protein
MFKAFVRAAIVFADDHILRYVDETAGQVTGIGCFKSRIGETFTGRLTLRYKTRERRDLL